MAETTEKEVRVNVDSGPSPISAQLYSNRPIVVKFKNKKKKKKRYTRNLKGTQKLERGVVRSTGRVASAVAAGLSTYRKRSNKSARNKRDGAIRDTVKNSSKAFSKTVRKVSKAPNDIIKQIGTKRIWKQARPVVELITVSWLR